MKLNVLKGTTSYVCHIFIQDSSSTTGAGLTGLTNASAGLTCYYMRAGASADVSVTLNTITTLGTYAGSATAAGFKEVDSTNMPGLYEFQPPNNALASGANQVILYLKGATNMAPLVLEFQLTSYDPNSTNLGLSNVSSNVVQWNSNAVATPTIPGIPDVNVADWLGVTPLAMQSGCIQTTVTRWNNVVVSTGVPNTSSVTLGALDSTIAINGTTNTSTSTTLVFNDSINTTTNYYVGCLVKVYSGTGADQARVVTASSNTTNVTTLTLDRAWTTIPTAGASYAVLYADSPALDSSLHVALSSAGLDNITVETGVNARQALAVIASALAGVLAGAATTTITIAAANNSGTNRITATVDANGNRSAVTLALP